MGRYLPLRLDRGIFDLGLSPKEKWNRRIGENSENDKERGQVRFSISFKRAASFFPFSVSEYATGLYGSLRTSRLTTPSFSILFKDLVVVVE